MLRNNRLRSIYYGDELPDKDKTDLTMGQAFDAYVTWATRHKKTTVSGDTYKYNAYLKPLWGDTKPVEYCSNPQD